MKGCRVDPEAATAFNGLAHVHGVIGVSGAIEIRWAEAYVRALREMAPSYGFGFVDGWWRIGRRFRPGAQAAAYLSSWRPTEGRRVRESRADCADGLAAAAMLEWRRIE